MANEMNLKHPGLRMHHLLPSSRANGPGTRAVLWVQGCTLGCAGCFNPLTHSISGGNEVSNTDIFNTIVSLRPAIEGITISGGEPLQQIEPLISLCAQIRSKTNLSIIVFTGFEWSEIVRIPRFIDLTKLVDVMITGRFDFKKRLARGLLGSSNKTIHFLTSRYNTSDFQEVPLAEIFIDPGGEITSTGIDPLFY